MCSIINIIYVFPHISPYIFLIKRSKQYFQLSIIDFKLLLVFVCGPHLAMLRSIPGFSLRNHSCWCLRDQMRCHGLNRGQPYTRQKHSTRCTLILAPRLNLEMVVKNCCWTENSSEVFGTFLTSETWDRNPSPCAYTLFFEPLQNTFEWLLEYSW